MPELDLIHWIMQQHKPSAAVPIPPGDDLAAISWPAGDLVLVGIDQVLEGVHFDRNQHDPQSIGAKAVKRNISDCAAMGCQPVAVVVSAALPTGIGDDYAKALQQGVNIATRYGCEVVGGDVGSWKGPLALTVAIIGRMPAGVSPVQRNGARPGDRIVVTGALGGSILGRHMTFEPRVELGLQLARTGQASAMIDISDGFAIDLNRICTASGVGTVIEADLLPIHDDAVELSRQTGKSALEHALYDGEDHELIACLPESAAIPEGVIEVGRITEGTGMLLRKGGRLQTLQPRGWEHTL